MSYTSELLSAGGSELLKGVPMASASAGTLFGVSAGRLVDLRTGAKSAKVPCNTIGDNVPTGMAVGGRNSMVACIDAGDSAGPLIVEDIATGKTKKFGSAEFMNVGPHVLEMRGSVVFGLVYDPTCGTRGYQNYPLRAARLDVATGRLTPLICTGAMVLQNGAPLLVERSQKAWKFWDEAAHAWINGSPQGSVENDVFYLDSSCLRVTSRSGCIATDVWGAFVFPS